ncbi:hypothetical protein [Streptomyces sp. NPDC058457]|uniref:hypothetical protein n=1 Tax=Streptomyces sp. NPDC058457 TaxID=3346507 RepID=UPI00365C75FE
MREPDKAPASQVFSGAGRGHDRQADVGRTGNPSTAGGDFVEDLFCGLRATS